MKLFSDIPVGWDNSNSAWYYKGHLFHLGVSQTHAMWLSEHGEDLGLKIIPVGFEDEWSEDWIYDMNVAFEHGFIRIQKFNDIATITVKNFSNKTKDMIFQMFSDIPFYFRDCSWIEVGTIDWEINHGEYSEPDDYWNGQYVNGRNIREVMENLG